MKLDFKGDTMYRGRESVSFTIGYTSLNNYYYYKQLYIIIAFFHKVLFSLKKNTNNKNWHDIRRRESTFFKMFQ